MDADAEDVIGKVDRHFISELHHYSALSSQFQIV